MVSVFNHFILKRSIASLFQRCRPWASVLLGFNPRCVFLAVTVLLLKSSAPSLTFPDCLLPLVRCVPRHCFAGWILLDIANSCVFASSRHFWRGNALWCGFDVFAVSYWFTPFKFCGIMSPGDHRFLLF
jgi:hypothetical protein